MTDEINIEQWAESRFEGLTKQQLLAAAKTLGLTFAPATAEKTMRVRLCETLGKNVDADEASKPKPAPRFKTNGIFDPKPELKNIDDWGGKRMSVRVYKPSADADSPQEYFQVTWEGQKRYFAYNINVDLAWPHFQALKNAEKTRLDQEELKDNKGILTGIKNVWTPSPRYHFNVVGVTPGTENLPESTLEYWQWQAKKHNNFKGLNRRTLQMIRSDLYGPVGNDFYKDMTDEDILYSVLEFLWGDFAEHELNEAA